MVVIVLMLRGSVVNKKKKPSMPMCTDKNENRFLALFFLPFILIPFLQHGSGLSNGGNHRETTSSTTFLSVRHQVHFNMQLSSEVSGSDCFKLNGFQVSWSLVAFLFLLVAPPCFDTSFPCHRFFLVHGISSCFWCYCLFATKSCEIMNHLSMINGL